MAERREFLGLAGAGLAATQPVEASGLRRPQRLRRGDAVGLLEPAVV